MTVPPGFVAALEQHPYCEAWTLSAEERSRHHSYRTDVLREELRASAGTLEAFLQERQMVSECGPVNEAVPSRVAQLVEKMNQLPTRTLGLTDSITYRRGVFSDTTQYVSERLMAPDIPEWDAVATFQLVPAPEVEFAVWLRTHQVANIESARNRLAAVAAEQANR